MLHFTSLPEIVAPSGVFLLRSFERTDARALIRNINSSHIADRVSNVPYPYTESDALRWFTILERAQASGYKERIDFAIDVNGKLVGSVAFIRIEGHKAQVSFWLGEEYHRCGLMTEAVKLLVRFGQTECGFVRMWAYTYGNNHASQGVLRKAGFTLEGIHRKEWEKNGVFHDSWVHAIVM